MNKYILLFLLTVGIYACTNSDELSGNNKPVAVKFTAAGIVAQVTSTRASTPSQLAAGTTVRVLAYRRAGDLPDLSADAYVGENTYVVGADGGTLTSNTGTELYLSPGTYDFYAITPALTVIREAGVSVSVPNGTDYAASLTGNVTFTSSSPTVALAMLERKCAQLVLNVDRGATSVNSVAVDELTLTGIASAPITGALNADLTATTGNDGTITIPESGFKTGDNPWQASASVVVLPKSDVSFQLSIKVRFNGSSTQRTLGPVTVPAIAFEKGKQYTYTLQLYGDKIVLTLNSVDNSWDNPISWETDLGDVYDLSQAATANCYLVNTANQDYKFKATVMGNGATTPSSTCGTQIAPAIVPTALSPASAFVIWETGSKGDVIQDGSVTLISNGYVTFKTANNNTSGNALIGVKDAAGNVIWSWHIWKTTYAPSTDDASTYDTYINYAARSFKMMKYNLGATNIITWSGSATVPGNMGLIYQFGRKDPFVGATAWSSATRIATTNTSGYEWKDASNSTTAIAATSGIVSGFSGADASIEYVRRNPTHFIYCSSTTTYDWLNVTTYATQRDNLWGNPNTTTTAPNTAPGSKSIYDPCPPGWRVPRQDSFTQFTTTGTNTNAGNAFNISSSFSNGWTFYIAAAKSGNTSFFPVVGYRLSGSGALSYVGSYTDCWSSSSSVSGNIFAGNLNFSAELVYPLDFNYRAYGFLVRCAQE
ncbi:BF2992 family fimbrillin-A clan protein [uncultured Bacteroides sp.]|uniref:BF2992 family fimbrillin-A clan protein n=1 Tax=uncultured Bacteroides sp. TaxID=162156 RepID=UPI002AA6F36B|nr:fimbrillin family protein [uncultured Bacteroides sp.]